MTIETRQANFFLVGAPKAGTTSLSRWLDEHPEVFMSPIKEPHHFDVDTLDRPGQKVHTKLDPRANLFHARVHDTSDYAELFAKAGNAKAIGEATTSYLYSQVAAAGIHDYNPNARILIVLREPVERAYSHFLMDLRSGWIDIPFIEAARISLTIPTREWWSQYVRLGLYYEQVRRYYEIFDPSQIKIVFHDEIQSDPAQTLSSILVFLGVSPETDMIDIETRHNAARLPRYSWTRRLFDLGRVLSISQLIPEALRSHAKKLLLTSKKPILDADDRREIELLFQQDLARLSSFLARSDVDWLR